MYIKPVAETYAGCLSKNHFHTPVHIKPETEIEFMKPGENDNRVFEKTRKYNPARQFANLFNTYAKACNLKYKRTGGLFETPFRRILISNEDYFRDPVFYIYNNPAKHGFANEINEYSWSSFSCLLSGKSSEVTCNKIFEWFDSVSEFIGFHKFKTEIRNLQHSDLDG